MARKSIRAVHGRLGKAFTPNVEGLQNMRTRLTRTMKYPFGFVATAFRTVLNLPARTFEGGLSYRTRTAAIGPPRKELPSPWHSRHSFCA